jgi:hypothetical protein
MMERDRTPLGRTAAEFTLNQDEMTLSALQQLRENKPDVYAQATRYAGMENIPADTVYRNVGEFEQRDRLRAAREVLLANPSISEWFARGDNSRMIDIENLNNLSGIRWLLSATSEHYTQGRRLNVRMNHLNTREMFGTINEDERAELGRLRLAPRADTSQYRWWHEGYTGAVEQVPILLSMLGGAVQYGLGGAAAFGTTAAILGQAGPQAATPEELVTVPAAAATGFFMGARVGAGVESFNLKAGEAWGE